MTPVLRKENMAGGNASEPAKFLESEQFLPFGMRETLASLGQFGRWLEFVPILRKRFGKIMVTAIGLLGATTYALAAGACVAAWKKRRNWYGQSPGRRGAFWLGAAAFMTSLAVVRLFAIDEAARMTFKLMAKSSGLYAARRGFQAELIVTITIVAILLAAAASWRFKPMLDARPSARLAAIALVGMAGHLFLTALRLVSLHGVDRVLYGPEHAGYILDVGCTALIVFAAVRFGTHRPRSRRPMPNAPWR